MSPFLIIVLLSSPYHCCPINIVCLPSLIVAATVWYFLWAILQREKLTNPVLMVVWFFLWCSSTTGFWAGLSSSSLGECSNLDKIFFFFANVFPGKFAPYFYVLLKWETKKIKDKHSKFQILVREFIIIMRKKEGIKLRIPNHYEWTIIEND